MYVLAQSSGYAAYGQHLLPRVMACRISAAKVCATLRLNLCLKDCSAMRPKIQSLLAQLNHALVEREATLKAALLTVLAGENMVLIGPPGTGKSLIARRVAASLSQQQQQPSYFEYLLTKFSTPEEIFGPLSINALKADRFERNTSGYLPSVQLAFLDEIFKASSSILNALLTILNERIFHNGAQAQHVPLQALIAASNELPTGQEELAALYDRFLVRSLVNYVSADGQAQLLHTAMTEAAPAADPITPDDMARLQQAIRAVTLPPAVQQALLHIWQAHQEAFQEDAREQLSDRRLMKCLHLLRVAAATNGRAEVNLSDVLLLKDCLWNHPDNAPRVSQMIRETINLFEKKEIFLDLTIMNDLVHKKMIVTQINYSNGEYIEKNKPILFVKEFDFIQSNHNSQQYGIGCDFNGIIKHINVNIGDEIDKNKIIAKIKKESISIKDQLISNIWL